MKIRHMILAAPLSGFVFILALGAGAYFGMKQQQFNLDEIVNTHYSRAVLAAQAEQQILQAHAEAYRTIAWSNNLDAAKMTAAGKKIMGLVDESEKIIKTFQGLDDLSSSEKEILDALTPQLPRYRKNAAQAVDMSSSDTATGVSMMQTADAAYQELTSRLAQFKQQQQQEIQEHFAAAQQQNHLMLSIGAVLMGCALLVAFLCAHYFARRIYNQLGGEPDQARRVMQRLADGEIEMNLQVAAEHSNSVFAGMQRLVATLKDFVAEQTHMAHQHNQQGLLSAQMDETRFSGAYRDMAHNVNQMVGEHIRLQVSLVDLTMQYANGDFRNRMETLPGEKKRVSDTAEAVRSQLEQAAKEAHYNARVKMALDSVSVPVRIADNDGKILYINQALRDTLSRYESAFRQQIPGFVVNRVEGGNIGMFYADPAAALERLRTMSGTVKTRLELGGRSYDVVTTVVSSARGERLGTVGQWVDMTDQISAEVEISGIVSAAIAGDFSQRVNESGKQGFFLQLAQGMNKILATNEIGLKEVVRVLSGLAQGDLTQKINQEFSGTFAQLKVDANTTTEKLADMIGQIRTSADTINTAAREIAMGNTDLSKRTEDQAGNLERTASSMEELTATVKQNAENACQANRLAASASEIASQGGVVVAEVMHTMDSITESSKKIVDIISVIDGIAFQTNILALNAAVEAARAGEQGRGFAVVASEVRSLAQRSANAAKEIKGLIGDSVGKVENGSVLVQQAGATMDQIVHSVKQVTDIMQEISTASAEQSGGIEQVNSAISQMDKVTQQNAALVEQAAAAAESMEEQAQSMARMVSIFKTRQRVVQPNAQEVQRLSPRMPSAISAATDILIAQREVVLPLNAGSG